MNEASTEINELAGSLSKLQGEIQDAERDQEGYGYKYAGLSKLLGIARPLLSKYRLAVAQPCGSGSGSGSGSDTVSVKTILMHESGQWICSIHEMTVERSKGMSMAQSVGRVITYLRKYGLSSMIGITQADNDGHIELDYSIKSETLKNLQAVIKNKEICEEWVNKCLAKAGVNKLENLDEDRAQKMIESIMKGGE